MQTLWTRAALSKGCCRCPQCISSAHAVSRRAATSTSRGISRYFTTSTALYTSIFAAAATFDAGNKQERREQWNRAIEQARLDLGHGESEFYDEAQEEVERLPLPQFKSFCSQEDDLDVSHVFARARRKHAADSTLLTSDLGRIDNEGPQQTPHLKPFGVELEDHEAPAVGGFKGLIPASKCLSTGHDNDRQPIQRPKFHGSSMGLEESDSFWPTNTGLPLLTHNLPPQSIYIQRPTRQQNRDQPWTTKKIKTSEMCIDMLQLKVFALMQKLGWSDEAASAVPEGYARHILQSKQDFIIEMNRAEEAVQRIRLADLLDVESGHAEFSGRLCCYTESGRLDSQPELAKLSSRMAELFSQHEARDISTPVLLAQLMHKLHASRSAPDVTVYNTLLQGLARAETPHVMRYVIGSLRGSNIRPNEVTLATILKHYVDVNKPAQFIHWIELIRGKHLGLGLAKPGTRITEAGVTRLIRRHDDPNKVIQLSYANPMVFREMIAGALKFGGFDMALRICEGMGKDGWGLCMQGMTPLLSDCAERADWGAGRAVWDNILALKQRSRRRSREGWEYESIRLPTFAAMLRLCIQCSQREMYDEVWTAATRIYRGDRNLETLTDLVNTTKMHKPQAADSTAHGPGVENASTCLPLESKKDRDSRSNDHAAGSSFPIFKQRSALASRASRNSNSHGQVTKLPIPQMNASIAFRVPTIDSSERALV